tara:strand:+ start:1796 stop:2431 length:636 start_codon:yes stop_codon:yes gene_type:complete
MNNDLKLIALHDKLESQIKAIQARVSSFQAAPVVSGKDGVKGATGASGKTGKDGKDGRDGKSGAEGNNGDDGVSIVDVNVDFDNHLRVELSNGETIDAGEIQSAKDDKGKQIIGVNRTTDKLKTGQATLDFGSSSSSASVVVTGVPSVRADSIVIASTRMEKTTDHSLDELLIDLIEVNAHSLVVGTGFTITGRMYNSEANGTYTINWLIN